MAQLGADVEQLDGLARRFQEESSQVDQLISRITSQINEVWWQGPDAERFKSEWQGTFTQQLRNISTALRDAGTNVSRQATAQREASNA
jgi:WXG100 family type VII secretion target